MRRAFTFFWYPFLVHSPVEKRETTGNQKLPFSFSILLSKGYCSRKANLQDFDHPVSNINILMTRTSSSVPVGLSCQAKGEIAVSQLRGTTCKDDYLLNRGRRRIKSHGYYRVFSCSQKWSRGNVHSVEGSTCPSHTHPQSFIGISGNVADWTQVFFCFLAKSH